VAIKEEEGRLWWGSKKRKALSSIGDEMEMHDKEKMIKKKKKKEKRVRRR